MIPVIRMGLSYHLERALLNALLLNFAFPRLETLYLALFHTNPEKDGRGQELVEAGYARAPISFGLAPGSIYVNSMEIRFKEASEDWGFVGHLAVFDKAEGGNMLFFGELDVPADMVAGEIATFPVGSIEVLWNPVPAEVHP